MSAAQQDGAILHLARPVSLLETGLLVLLIHAALLFLPFGLAGLLLAELPEPVDEPELRLTFGPDADDPTDIPSSIGGLPGAPVPTQVPLETPPSTPTLDAGPTIPASPALPVEQDASDADSEAPSAGLDVDTPAIDEVFEDPVDSQAPPDEQLVTAEEAETFDDVVEAAEDSFVPEDDDGSMSAFREPPGRAPVAAPGRPSGPSLQQRLSDFGREMDRVPVQANQPQQPRNSFEPDWGSLPMTGQAIGNMSFSSGDFDWDDYYRQIYPIIWKAWHNRLYDRTDDFEKWGQHNRRVMLDHINGVRFTILRSGQIVDIQVTTDSGCPPFDLTSVEGLDEAILPRLPADFPRDAEVVDVWFLGQGPIPDLRRTLAYYKRLGLF